MKPSLPKDQQDLLVTYLQLNQQLDKQENELLLAAINQKVASLSGFEFVKLIRFKSYAKGAKWFSLMLAFFFLGSFFLPTVFVSPSVRLWNFSIHYSKKIPFQFIVHHQPLRFFVGQKNVLSVELEGAKVPEVVQVLMDGEEIPMKRLSNSSTFELDLPAINSNKTIQFEAGGYYSDPYELQLVNLPGIQSSQLELIYPSYLNKPNEKLDELMNLEIPEGTELRWVVETSHAEKLGFIDLKSKVVNWIHSNLFNSHRFEWNAILRTSFNYQIFVQNQFSPIQKSSEFSIKIIPDQYPKMDIQVLQDTLYYRFLAYQLRLEDDYGLKKIQFAFQVKRKSSSSTSSIKMVEIPLVSKMAKQALTFPFLLDSLNLKPEDELSYFFILKDNDALHGFKQTKSAKLTWIFPNSSQLSKQVVQSFNGLEKQVSETVSQVKELKKDLETLSKQILLGKNIDNRSKEQLLNKEKEYQDAIEKLKELQTQIKNQLMSLQSPNLSLLEKMNQLEKMIQQLISERKNEEASEFSTEEQESSFEKKIDQMRKQNKLANQELKRLEKFYQDLKMESMADQLVQDLKSMAKRQEELIKHDEQKTEKQSQLKEEFERLKNEIDKLNEEDQKSESMHIKVDEQVQHEVEEALEKAQEHLSQKKNKEAEKSQQKAKMNLEKLAKSIEEQLSQSVGTQLSLNLTTLRSLMEDLLQMSFKQESLFKQVNKSNEGDAQLRVLAKNQIRLADMAKVMQDSLNSLAKKVIPLSSALLRQSNEMGTKLTEASRMMKERKWELVAYRQQEAMTSMNRLAVMLSDLLRQLQNQQQQTGSGKKQKDKNGKGGDWAKKQTSMQSKMRKMGQTPQGMSSEELVRLAEEQSRLRREIEQKIDELNRNNPGKGDWAKELDEIKKELERNETDIVNRNINNELIQRQNALVPKLMEAEKALKEQGEDPKRESKNAIQIWKETIPPNLAPILKKQFINKSLYEKVPAELLPHYQQKVLDYLKGL